MASKIQVPIELIRDTADRLLEYADQNADIFDRLYNSLQVLEQSGAWRGLSIQAAMNATLQNQDRFDEALNDLYDLASFMRNFVNDIESADQHIKARILYGPPFGGGQTGGR